MIWTILIVILLLAFGAAWAWLYFMGLGLRVATDRARRGNEWFARMFGSTNAPAAVPVQFSKIDRFWIRLLIPQIEDLPAETVFSVASYFTTTIDDGRTDKDVIDHMRSELDELQAEIDDPENPGPDGIFGEAIDVIACAVDIIRRRYPEMSVEDLEKMASEKMREKCIKWRNKAEAGEYSYQQR